MTNLRDRHGPKGESEFSDYQKEIEATDNVILCVAKAEKMIRAIGASLCKESDTPAADHVEPGPVLEEYK
ncbi:MAG: hypothetical protein LDL33_00485 [Desulfomonile sp.]|nr:hypothetical protein [Desulfomonile sp.]